MSQRRIGILLGEINAANGPFSAFLELASASNR